MTRKPIAARREPGQAGHYSWMSVLPVPAGGFRVAAIEVPEHFVDDDESFFEDDMTTTYVKVVENVDEVDDAVREAGVDPDDLAAPWHSDFPL